MRSFTRYNPNTHSICTHSSPLRNSPSRHNLHQPPIASKELTTREILEEVKRTRKEKIEHLQQALHKKEADHKAELELRCQEYEQQLDRIQNDFDETIQHLQRALYEKEADHYEAELELRCQEYEKQLDRIQNDFNKTKAALEISIQNRISLERIIADHKKMSENPAQEKALHPQQITDLEKASAENAAQLSLVIIHNKQISERAAEEKALSSQHITALKNKLISLNNWKMAALKGVAGLILFVGAGLLVGSNPVGWGLLAAGGLVFLRYLLKAKRMHAEKKALLMKNEPTPIAKTSPIEPILQTNQNPALSISAALALLDTANNTPPRPATPSNKGEKLSSEEKTSTTSSFSSNSSSSAEYSSRRNSIDSSTAISPNGKEVFSLSSPPSMPSSAEQDITPSAATNAAPSALLTSCGTFAPPVKHHSTDDNCIAPRRHSLT